jgi:hypothetical protein
MPKRRAGRPVGGLARAPGGCASGCVPATNRAKRLQAGKPLDRGLITTKKGRHAGELPPGAAWQLRVYPVLTRISSGHRLARAGYWRNPLPASERALR